MGYKFDPRHAHRLTAEDRLRREQPDRWFPRLGLRPGLTIAEIGVGPGFYIPYILDHITPHGFLVGTDIRREMLCRARDRIPDPRRVALVETEEVRLPLRDAALDGVFLVHLLHELDDPDASLAEIYRVLKPHGILWVWDWDPRGPGEHGPPPEKRIAPREARRWLEHAGFRVEELPVFVPEHYFFRAIKPPSWEVFETQAQRYDAWFDTEPGRTLFRQELSALFQVWTPVAGPCTVEIGVGSGRFARPLGVDMGLDPAGALLAMARNRGIRVVRARAEDLPLASASVDQALMVVTLCFVEDPQRALDELRRVLKPAGIAVLGWIPADSPWGRAYRDRARTGHRFYRAARFVAVKDLLGLLTAHDFQVEHAVSTLLSPPETFPPDPTLRAGIEPRAGFIALRCRLRPT